MRDVLRIGTRGSLLALAQTRQIAERIQDMHPALRVELVIIRTTGDQVTDRPLHDIGGKGLFTRELEVALLDQRVDVAVHSLKDVPVTQPLVDTTALMIAAIPLREDARDAWVCPAGLTLEQLPPGSRVATGSLRRQAQLLHHRPDLRVTPIRGNIDTRLGKVRQGAWDAAVLAMAGLRRAGLWEDALMRPLDASVMLPAAGQGALALQCRAADHEAQEWLTPLDDAPTRCCVLMERELVKRLEGDCRSPIGAYASLNGSGVHLRACVARAGGGLPVLFAEGSGPAGASDAVNCAYKSLQDQGVQGILGHCR